MAAEAIGTIPGGGGNYGDIYSTATPNTEAAGQELAGLQGRILAQQQRYQAVQKNAKLKEAADQQNKIDAQVRGADVPSVHSAYNDWRAASMDLQQNSKNLPRDEYLARQAQVNQKYADVTKLIAQSTQGKTQDEEDLKNQADQSKSLLFNDNAHNILNQRISTPITQWSTAPVLDSNGKPVMDENGKPKTQDLSDPSLQRYTPKEDFQPLIQTAVGKSEKLNGGIPVGNQNGINRTTKDYTGSNSAYNIANTLSQGLQSDDKKNNLKAVDRQMDLLHQYGNVSDADIAATDKQYNEQYVTNPDVKAAYGLTGKETFPTTGNPKIDGIVRYIAEKQAMLPDNMPKVETKVTTNEAAKTAEDHQWDIYKINYGDKLKKKDDLGAGKSIDDNYNVMTQGNGNTVTTKVANQDGSGTFVDEKRKEISAPTPLLNAFEVQATDDKGQITKIKPDKLFVRPNGNIIGAYYQRNPDGSIAKSDNGNIPSRTDITPVELDGNTAKLAVAKAIGGDKAVESLSKYQSQPKSYSKQALLSKGWSQSQINQAVKAGKINLQD